VEVQQVERNLVCAFTLTDWRSSTQEGVELRLFPSEKTFDGGNASQWNDEKKSGSEVKKEKRSQPPEFQETGGTGKR